MATRTVETSDWSETEALGADLAASLRPGDVVLVRGDLGAGKTTFVRGAARALGVADLVTSPTFGIGHRYRGEGVAISHLDLYRLAGLEREEPDLLADYLGAGRIAFVEWPEQGAPELSSPRLVVTLAHAGGDRRTVEIQEADGERGRVETREAEDSGHGGNGDPSGVGAPVGRGGAS